MERKREEQKFLMKCASRYYDNLNAVGKRQAFLTAISAAFFKDDKPKKMLTRCIAEHEVMYPEGY